MVGRRSPKSLVRVRFLPPVLDRKAILFLTKSTPKSAFMLTQRELIRCHAQIRPNFIPIHYDLRLRIQNLRNSESTRFERGSLMSHFGCAKSRYCGISVVYPVTVVSQLVHNLRLVNDFIRLPYRCEGNPIIFPTSYEICIFVCPWFGNRHQRFIVISPVSNSAQGRFGQS